MIIDSSAVIAIIGDELEAPELMTILSGSFGNLSMSAANYMESAIVLDGERYEGQSHRLDELVSTLSIEIVPVTLTQAKIARQAYRDFGKGNGHPAKLNFGDCFAYALAKDRNKSLVYKGDDFGHTDVSKACLI
jgi:ribonuclease VapC